MTVQEDKRLRRYRRFLIIELSIFLSILAAFFIYINSETARVARDIRKNDHKGEYVSAGLISDADSDVNGQDYIIESTPGDAVSFTPHYTASTDPEKFIRSTEIEINGIGFKDTYNSSEQLGELFFGDGDEYTDVEGIVTFRGNNYRDDPTYGHADIKEGSMSAMWHAATGVLSYDGALWSGSGWTGQPLMRHWSAEEKQHMNMYDNAKEKNELVEVIYACMDGYIYFLDMDTGEPTRDRLFLGYAFKGAGALDPRGYPILYLGAGYDSDKGYARAFVINLIDCSVLKEFGSVDPFALRGTLSYFDSSALVDADTDTLIYPGENGVLYLVHLGTHYDRDAGTLTMDFDKTVKWRYNSKRTTHDKFWPGMETSAAIYEHYMYITDNGANLLCIDLNTLNIVWVQDILDDSNSTPVLSVEGGRIYLYVSTSFHLGWRSSTTANVPIWKIDAETGEIIWKTEYECTSEEGVSGGVQSTIAVGKESLNNYVYVTVAMTHGRWGGDIVALDKKDGSKAWEKQIAYTWSSPVCVYDGSGNGEVIYAASDGNIYIVDGINGDEKSRLNLSDGNIEASPAVYNDTVIIGTRAGRICAVKLK